MTRSNLRTLYRPGPLLFAGLLSLVFVLAACEGTPTGTPTTDPMSPGVGTIEPGGGTPTVPGGGTPTTPDPSTPAPGTPIPGTATPGATPTLPGTPTPTAELTMGSGTVVSNNASLFLMEIALEDGSEEAFGVQPDAEVTVDGAPGSLEDISEGDMVQIEYDADSMAIYSIEATAGAGGAAGGETEAPPEGGAGG